MVKAYTQEHVYQHPWERVTSAFWRKYTDPGNAAILSHILQVDTLSRSLDPSTGRLHSTRVVTVHAPIPRFLSRLIGMGTDGKNSFCHCVETSVVDPAAKSMAYTVRNVSFSRFIEVLERTRYDPHPENPNWTLFRQETSIRCLPVSAIAALAERIEQRFVDKFTQNSVKGREVMEAICSLLEGVESAAAPTAIE